MDPKIFFVFAFTALLSFSFTGAAATYTCNSCDDCTGKISSASPGDTVYLTANITNRSGTCIEFGNTVGVTFDCQGQEIEGNPEWYSYGIYLKSSSNNTITNCNISFFEQGIRLNSSSGNALMDNTVENSFMTGVYLYYSDNNTLTGNTANNNGYAGIGIASSNDNTLTGNTANNNREDGIGLTYSNASRITKNTANNNSDGINLNYAYGNYLSNNTANNNTYDGVVLSDSNDSTVTENTANNNSHGIDVFNSLNCTFTNNTASNNSHGIYVSGHGDVFNSNYACSNTVLDLNSFMGWDNSGDNNTCDNSSNWDDAGAVGCTYSCSGVTTTTTTTSSTAATTTTTTSSTTTSTSSVTTTTTPTSSTTTTTIQPACTDSDGGLNVYVKGTVSGVNASGASYGYTDSCINAFTLNEWTCGGSTPGPWQVTCTTGYTCQDGVCITSASTTTTTMTTTTTSAGCDLPGDSPPCGEVTLSEVIDMINLWASGQASLGNVIDLINAWAGG